MVCIFIALTRDSFMVYSFGGVSHGSFLAMEHNSVSIFSFVSEKYTYFHKDGLIVLKWYNALKNKIKYKHVLCNNT